MRSGSDGGPRVLLVCGDLRPGLDGVADYVTRLAAELRAAGATVRILCTGPEPSPPGARSVGRRWTPSALATAARAARGADVVHVQFAPSMYRFRAGIGLLPPALGRAPLVVTLHEYGWWRWERALPGRLWRLVERRRLADRETVLLVPRAAAAVVTNPAHAAVLQRRFAGRVRSTAVPIGANVGVAEVDRATARREVRAELGVAADAVLVAFFGFVHPVKGVRYLAEAVATLVAEGRDVHLLVVGGFESLALPADEARAFERELRGQVADAGAGERTAFTGFLAADAASRLLAACDLACLPFTAGVTAKSGSLLTVLAHGLPTLVTAPPDGADPELADGLRVLTASPVRDGAALATGLRRLLDDPGLAARVAEAGKAWAAERDWSGIAARHLALYAEVGA
ncbi:glycosyltransferase family 4 protein [Amnibacterium endophyticum]|uniref:Glycosyltransferase family 4 protein n=1 Tax=Amnibacterium endophyticum TaxID=2109337 RepID=A0ABW4LCI3_9MICO